MSLYVAHHGETLESLTDCLAGPNASLTALGEYQALQVAKDLAGKLALAKVTTIVSSPRTRAMRAATIIAERFGMAELDIKKDERLMERNLKTFIGRRRKDVFTLSEAALVAEGAEPLEGFAVRNRAVYQETLTVPGTTLFVTHRGNIPVLFEAANRSLPAPLVPAQAYLLWE